MASFKKYTASGGASEAFSIPSFTSDEIKVRVEGVLKTATTHYNITSYTSNGGTVTWTSGNVPSSGTVYIYRDTNILNSGSTDVEAKATFTTGTAIYQNDINNNQKQALRALEEKDDQLIQSWNLDSGVVETSSIKDGTIVDADINASANIAGSKLADDSVTLAKLGGGALPTDITVASANIVNGTIVDADISGTAEIAVSKLADGTARQILQTASNGNDVEWTSNVDVPGTLDVTGAADFDSTVNVDGTATLATVDINAGAIDGTTIGANSAAAGTFTTGTIATADINGGAIDGTVIGASSTAAGSFTTVNASGTITGNVTGNITGNVTGDVTGDVTGNADTATDLAASAKITNSEQASHSANDTTYFTTSASDARYFNVSTGDTIKDGDAFPDNDTTIATTAAINDRIIDLVDDVGGFVPIANETSFPTANPDVNNGTGTLVSIKEFASSHTPSGGSVTIANGAGSGNTVTITGCGSTVLAAGYGGIVETTSTLHTYTFHRLSPKSTEVTTVASISSNITTVAGDITNINAVAGNATNINAVAGNASNINAVAGNATNINSAVSNATNINVVAGDITNVNTTAGAIANVNTVAGSISNVNTVSTNISDINNFADLYQIATSAPTQDGGGNSLATGDLWYDSSSNKALMIYDGSSGDGFSAATPTAQVLQDIAIVSGQLTYIEDLGLIGDAVGTGSGNNISTVASSITNVNTCAGAITNINNVGGIVSDVSTVAAANSNISTAASNIASINNFAEVYRISSSAPTSSLNEGDLWYDSTGNTLKYYTGSAWVVTAAAGLSEVIEDTTPELGGHLDCNDKNLTEVGTVSGDNLQIDFGTLT
tara:strand:+ start:13586 stop:16105 length:2520 start_codon:yes stop_codon:yes gene_type:complete